MPTDYQPEAWRDLFMMLGTTAGALVGLLFIVMSLHLDRLSDLPEQNMRVTIEGSRYNILHLLTVVVEAAMLLVPQPLLWLAVELVAINLFGLRLPLIIIRRYARRHLTISERGGFPTGLIVTVIAAYLLGATGGGLMTLSPVVGLYLVTAGLLIKIVRSALTAWMFMFVIRRAEI